MKQELTPWQSLPWNDLYRFINKCGSIHDIRGFSTEILQGLGKFVPFDQGLVFFLDANQKPHNQYLLNIRDSWIRMYLDYYSKANLSQYGVDRSVREVEGKPYIAIHHWADEPKSSFLTDYINARGLKRSLGFVLFDLNGIPRTVFALDRLSDAPFSDREMDILYVLVPTLNNLHKNFYASASVDMGAEGTIWEQADLTRREIEVVNMLCQGISPGNISSTLHIASSTTYKHIAHIYEKLKINSLQELLVKALNSEQ